MAKSVRYKDNPRYKAIYGYEDDFKKTFKATISLAVSDLTKQMKKYLKMDNFGIQSEHNKRKMQIARHFKGNDVENLNDFLQKGKSAQEGEEREWKGRKYKKIQGKWVEQTKGKSSKKDDDKSKSSDSKQQTSSVDGHEIAQMTHMKKILDGDPDKAYEIYQSLSPEAQSKVPQDVVNKLVENSHKEKQDDAAKVFEERQMNGTSTKDLNNEQKQMLGVLSEFSGTEIRSAAKKLGITEIIDLKTVGDIASLKDSIKQKIKKQIQDSKSENNKEHDNVIERKGQLFFDTLDADTEEKKFKEGEEITHRGKKYVIGKEKYDDIHELKEVKKTKSKSKGDKIKKALEILKA